MMQFEVFRENEQVGHLDCIIRKTDSTEETLHNYGYHSPDGFQIGYGGSGPADLAYSILIYYYLDGKVEVDKAKEYAEAAHQQFKWKFIAPEKRHLVITDREITMWLCDSGFLCISE